ncbi:MAG: hypothetical protein SGILL_009610, partial [Bacillariaceae sp.]
VPAADNVVDLVKEKLQHDCEAKQILPIAACIGASFDVPVLTLLVEKFRDLQKVSGADDLQDLRSFLSLDFDLNEKLAMCVSEGYIERDSRLNGYHFIHDRVQEAALAVCPENIRSRLKYQVGLVLAKELSEERIETMIFSILGLLTAGSDLNPSNNGERLFFLNLYTAAGKKALRLSAFASARNYFNTAISMLPTDAWQRHYDVTLDLYTYAAEAEYSVADFESMHRLIDVLMDEPAVPPTDKLVVAHLLIDAGVAEYKPKESIKKSLDVLERCGLPKIPRRDFSVSMAAATGLMRTKFSKKMQNPGSITELKITSDPAHAAVMKTLDHLATAAYVSKPDLFPVIVLRSIRYTFEHGITLFSPAAFALNGLLLSCFMDDFAAGWTFAKNALSMLKRLDCKEVESRVYFVAYTYPAQWTKPMQDCMKPLRRGYEVGMSTGDLQSAFYCATFYCEISFYTGVSLSVVDENMAMYSKVMGDFGHHSIHRGVKMLHQAVRVLRNDAGSNNGKGAMLTGDLMDQEKMIKQFEDQNDTFYVAALQRYRPILACYVGDYESGADLAIEWTDK